MMTADRPAASVILPTYDRAERLPTAIQSVLKQTFADFELIVVDDASTDETEAAVAEFDDPRLRYIRHETNQGVSAARNTGIKRAQGAVIAFQDSDDEWAPEKLRKQMNVFDEAPTEVGVVYTGMQRTEGGETRYLPYSGVEYREGDITRSLLRRNFISTQMAAVRRECFDEVGLFDEALPALVDWDLWLRLAAHYRFRLVDEPLVVGAVHPDSISKNRSDVVQARKRILTKHGDRFDRDSLANHLFYVGHGAMKAGQGTRGRRYLRKAIQLKPCRQYSSAFLLSLFGTRIYTATYRAVKYRRNTQ